MSGGQSETAPAAEWLTIPDAAAKFGVGERALRRAVDREKERGANADNNAVKTRQVTRQTKTGERSAAAFDAALLSRLAADLGAADGESGQSDAPSPNAAETVSEGGANVTTNAAAELLEQLRGEVAFLRSQLERETANTAAALGELQRANDRAAVLIAAVGAGRLTLPPMPTGEPSNEVGNASPAPVADAAQETTHGDLRAGSGGLGQTAAHDKPRPFWWAFWQKKEGG